MKNPLSPRAKRVFCALFFGALALALALSLLEVLLPPEADPLSLLPLAVRATAAAAILFLLLSEGMLSLRPRIPRDGALLCAISLVFLVGINNFPFLDLLAGRTSVTVTAPSLLVYTLTALATAAFEELLFRGLLFPLVCARIIKREGKRDRRPFGGLLPPVLLSSALFSLLHLVNLAVAPVGDTLLQVAYTFGIGILASLLYLFTRSLLFPIAFHAIYNFGGLFLSHFGGRNDPATVTVVTTAALSLSCAAVCACALARYAGERAKIEKRQEK